jgi:hypothetical protein
LKDKKIAVWWTFVFHNTRPFRKGEGRKFKEDGVERMVICNGRCGKRKMDAVVRSDQLLIEVRRLERYLNLGRYESVLAGLAVKYLLKCLLKDSRFTFASLFSAVNEH